MADRLSRTEQNPKGGLTDMVLGSGMVFDMATFALQAMGIEATPKNAAALAGAFDKTLREALEQTDELADLLAAATDDPDAVIEEFANTENFNHALAYAFPEEAGETPRLPDAGEEAEIPEEPEASPETPASTAPPQSGSAPSEAGPAEQPTPPEDMAPPAPETPDESEPPEGQTEPAPEEAPPSSAAPGSTNESPTAPEEVPTPPKEEEAVPEEPMSDESDTKKPSPEESPAEEPADQTTTPTPKKTDQESDETPPAPDKPYQQFTEADPLPLQNDQGLVNQPSKTKDGTQPDHAGTAPEKPSPEAIVDQLKNERQRDALRSLAQNNFNLQNFLQQEKLDIDAQTKNNLQASGAAGVGKRLGSELKRRIATGDIRAYHIALMLALTKDAWDLVETFITGGLMASLLNIIISSALYIILYSQSGWIMGMIKRYYHQRIIAILLAEFVPILGFLPLYTFLIISLKRRADKDLKKHRQALKKISMGMNQLQKQQSAPRPVATPRPVTRSS